MEKEEILLGLIETEETYTYKDWGDYVLIIDKYIETYHDKNKGFDVDVYDIYYMIHNEPFPGDGFFKCTEKIEQPTLENYLDKVVFNRYKNYENIEVRNIIKKQIL